ncbi:unnamed protein product [Tuber melanosporum]|uniref:(Perigord truffle) hypothetical protein n=1 Tax=Tuber melanosporum (strain Mel28) TaxID=656061 RepID=D5GGY4_TUBMM|nr:uncharacterized protein GSTUM_00007618001 [Tuber melanosporum]CAZ83777.1 unnamed protein product [Tuber melanosporum]
MWPERKNDNDKTRAMPPPVPCRLSLSRLWASSRAETAPYQSRCLSNEPVAVMFKTDKCMIKREVNHSIKSRALE